MERPEWLSNIIFQEILEESINKEFKIRIFDVSVERAGRKENYSCNLIRATVKYTQGMEKAFRFHKFIVKADLSVTQCGDMVNDYDMSHLEPHCYTKVLPRVHALLKSIGDNTKIAAKCYKANTESRPRYLILEDLRDWEVQYVDRISSQDLKEMEMVMILLAKYHATTAYLGTIEPELFARNHILPINMDLQRFHAFFKNSMKTCAEIVLTWPGCEKYGQKLLELVNTATVKGNHTYDRDDSKDAFNVLSHSDLRIDNAKFKYREDGVAEVLFAGMDGYYGSPGMDLSYFLFSSNVEGYGEKEWDHLLRVYHEELIVVLSKLGYKKKLPSLLDIHMEMMKRSLVSLMNAMFLIPLRFVENAKDAKYADLGAFLSDEPEKVAFRQRMCSSPMYRAFLEPVLEFCYRKGLLEA